MSISCPVVEAVAFAAAIVVEAAITIAVGGLVDKIVTVESATLVSARIVVHIHIVVEAVGTVCNVIAGRDCLFVRVAILIGTVIGTRVCCVATRASRDRCIGACGREKDRRTGGGGGFAGFVVDLENVSVGLCRSACAGIQACKKLSEAYLLPMKSANNGICAFFRLKGQFSNHPRPFTDQIALEACSTHLAHGAFDIGNGRSYSKVLGNHRVWAGYSFDREGLCRSSGLDNVDLFLDDIALLWVAKCGIKPLGARLCRPGSRPIRQTRCICRVVQRM